MDDEMKKHALSFEYDEITPQLFLGTTMCCQLHFEKELLEKGITIDISMQEEHIDAPFGVEMFSWIPVKNNTAPTQDQLRLGVSIIDNLVKEGKKAYVHCRFGHGRGPTMIAAYLISQGQSTDEALKFITEKRPVVHLVPDQVAALEEFEKSP